MALAHHLLSVFQLKWSVFLPVKWQIVLNKCKMLSVHRVVHDAIGIFTTSMVGTQFRRKQKKTVFANVYNMLRCYVEFHYEPKFVSIFLHVKLNKMNSVPSYLRAIKHFKASLLSNWRLFERKFSRIARFELKQNEYHAQLQAPIYMFSFEKNRKKRIKTKCAYVHIIYPAQKLIALGQCLLLWRLFIFLSW